MQTDASTKPREREVPASGGTLASLLRWLGAGTLGLSALVYMLQGVEQIDLQLRNWVYLILMALLCGGGVLSRLVMDDAKSARLFFALATALVPVQFSQLGGMVFEFFTVNPAAVSSAAGSPLVTAAVAITTLALAAPVAFVGFSVLARAEARHLCLLFLAVNGALLLPARTSLVGIAVLVCLAVATLVMERALFAPRPLYRTTEGKAIRAMFALPLIIALARAGFHADTTAGYCALGGIASLVIIGGCRHWIAGGALRELALLGGMVLGVCSWSIYTLDVLQWGRETYPLLAILLPIAVLALAAGSCSDSLGRVYRTVGCAIMAWVTYLLISWEATPEAALNALLIAVGLLAWGIRMRYREPTLAGSGLALASLLSLSVLALRDISTSTWIVLAAAGLISVLAASVVERFGRRLLAAARTSWADVSGWR